VSIDVKPANGQLAGAGQAVSGRPLTGEAADPRGLQVSGLIEFPPILAPGAGRLVEGWRVSRGTTVF